jgi:NAD+ synthetase
MILNTFDAEKEIEGIVAWIREWFADNGPKATAVIGLSGGKDSTIVANLLVRALGKERVVGVLMPNGVQADIADSLEVAQSLDIKYYVVNIADAVNGLKNTLTALDGFAPTKDMEINIPPRIRMTTLYAVAQAQPMGGRVVNTCNRSEDYIGYSTKYGDAAGDFSPCANYTVTEMLLLGAKLGIASHLVHKAPSDGLSGMTDEEKIGFTYDTLDRYILTGECEDAALKAKIDRMHVQNLHKLKTIPTYPRA